MAYDLPWKKVLHHMLNPCLAMINPELHKDIDWSIDPIPLDKELEKIAVGQKDGGRFVDKLFKVRMLNGEEKWILLHIEVQNQHDPEFARRMFTYNYRIFDKYGEKVISLAILGDLDPDWRPDSYSYGGYGSEMSFKFKVAKLLDYLEPEGELENNLNPFALVILAHLKARMNAGGKEDQQIARARAKIGLLRMLFSRGYDREQIKKLFLFIDWVMNVPKDLDNQLKEALHKELGEDKMEYISGWERQAKEEGKIEGKIQGKIEGKIEGEIKARKDVFLRMAGTRFGKVPAWAFTRVDKADIKQLDQWSDLLFSNKTLEEIINS